MAKRRARKGDEDAEKLARQAVVENKQQSVDPIPGQIILDLETADGETVQKTYRIRPGHPRVWLAGRIVSTAALLKLANNQELTDKERQENPGLAVVDADAAREFLAGLAATGSYLLEEIGE